MPAPRTPSVLRAVPALAVVLSLSACGGGDGAADAAPNDAPPAASQGTPRDGQVRPPGAIGLVAAVDGTTAQVQGNDTQTAVSWTPATTFTAQATGSLADIAAGSCVVVRSSDTSGSDSTAVTATSLAVTEPENGECAGPGGAGGFPGDARPPGGALPSGIPTAFPSGAPGGRGGFGGFGAFGEVTAVTSAGFTVRSARPGPPGEAGAAPETQDVTVTVDADTTVTKTVPAAADAVQPGVCVTATGEADSTGAVIANAIAVRPAEDGACGGGFDGPGTPNG